MGQLLELYEKQQVLGSCDRMVAAANASGLLSSATNSEKSGPAMHCTSGTENQAEGRRKRR